MSRLITLATVKDRVVSASLATFEPCESDAVHREVAMTVVGLSRRPG